MDQTNVTGDAMAEKSGWLVTSCRKCGHDQFLVRYRPDGDYCSEALAHTCQRCSFVFYTPCKDAKDDRSHATTPDKVSMKQD